MFNVYAFYLFVCIHSRRHCGMGMQLIGRFNSAGMALGYRFAGLLKEVIGRGSNGV
jgi:hypothetical protein